MNFTADDGTVGRVDLYDFNALPVATGDEVRLDLAVAKTGQHPAVPTGLAHNFFDPKHSRTRPAAISGSSPASRDLKLVVQHL